MPFNNAQSPAPPLEAVFGALFAHLEGQAYAWPPMSPERIQRCRETPEAYDALIRCFGLGFAPEWDELGIPDEWRVAVGGLRPAVSRVGEWYVPHTPWFDAGREVVYLGEETLELMGRLPARLDGLRALDLGSGSGALAFGLASRGASALGIESSGSAVSWARAAAKAQRIPGVEFLHARIGEPAAERECGTWDLAVFNPPLAVPEPSANRPHRDGGELGIGIPLLFLEHARRHLRAGGEVHCTTSNPIVHGRAMFFERLNPRHWEIVARERLNSRFNQGLYRQGGYAALGIERVELWYLHLRRR